MRRTRGLTRTAALLVSALASAAVPSPALAQQSVQGILHLVWEDPRDDTRPPALRFLLGTTDGELLRLETDEATARNMGWAALAGRTVRVSGDETGAPGASRALRVRTLAPLGGDAATAVAPAVAPAVAGAQPFALLLCRSTDYPNGAMTAAQYETLLLDTSYPGVDHYYREVSAGAASLAGSSVLGWFDLPLPRSGYWIDGDSTLWDLALLASDCVAAADPTVDFGPYAGVAFQYSFHMPYSWGGSASLSADDSTRVMRTAWLANWAGRHVYAHELGHTFGLPHSSGPYADTYDSKWDVMSAYAHFDLDYDDWIGHHTIGVHKDRLGWIPPERRFAPAPGTRTSITLDRSAQPPAGDGMLFVEVPLVSEATLTYTLEARRTAGYDQSLPGEGVVLHRVLPACFGFGDRCARVVDADDNGNVNDEGSYWEVGESFTDWMNGFSFTVDASSDEAYQVTVTRGWPITITAGAGGRVVAAAAGIDCVAGTCETVLSDAHPTLQLSAEPESGYRFDAWSGDCAGAESTCTLDATTPRTVQATFSDALVTLTVIAAGTGSGTVSGDNGFGCVVTAGAAQGTCSVEVPIDGAVTLSAVAAEGSTLGAWSGACIPDGATCAAWMGTDRSIGIRFDAATPRFQLSLIPQDAGDGRVTSSPAGIDCTMSGLDAIGTCAHEFDADAIVTLTAEPANGSTFAGWGGACAPAGITCAAWMGTDRVLGAKFIAAASIELTVVSTGPGSGTVYSEPEGIACAVTDGAVSGTCSTVQPPDGLVRLVAQPAGGHAFRGWSGACAPEGDDCVAWMHEPREVRFAFDPPAQELIVNLVGPGGGHVGSTPQGIDCAKSAAADAVACEAQFAGESLVALTATPAEGSTFAAWSGPCIASGDACVAWMAAARDVTARFALPGAPPAPDGLTPARIASALLGRASLTADEARVVDGLGNRNGRVDLGDLVAWQRRASAARGQRGPR